jgi:hypothetical protein
VDGVEVVDAVIAGAEADVVEKSETGGAGFATLDQVKT